MDIEKKNREFVVPGDEIVKAMDYLPGKNTFRDGDSIYAKRTGLLDIRGRVISVIPLNSAYAPSIGDMVIGVVEEIQSSGWLVNIRSMDLAYLPLAGVRGFIDTNKTDLSRVYDIEEVIYAKISRANQYSVSLTMQDMRAKKLRGGRVIKLNPAKIPRLIGKQGSMISLIKSKTGCRISVGQNGLIWMDGDNQDLVIKVVETIMKECYTDGLTDRVEKLLEDETKKVQKKEDKQEK